MTTTQRMVTAYAIETPFGTMAYQIGAPDADRNGTHVTFWITPAGDLDPAEALTFHTGDTLWKDGSVTVNTEACYAPTTPLTILRTYRPLTINGKEYGSSFSVKRLERPDGQFDYYADTSILGAGFTVAARKRLSDWLTQHDAEFYGEAKRRAEEYASAYNKHADALNEAAEAQKAADTARLHEVAAWDALRKLQRR